MFECLGSYSRIPSSTLILSYSVFLFSIPLDNSHLLTFIHSFSGAVEWKSRSNSVRIVLYIYHTKFLHTSSHIHRIAASRYHESFEYFFLLFPSRLFFFLSSSRVSLLFYYLLFICIVFWIVYCIFDATTIQHNQYWLYTIYSDAELQPCLHQRWLQVLQKRRQHNIHFFPFDEDEDNDLTFRL